MKAATILSTFSLMATIYALPSDTRVANEHALRSAPKDVQTDTTDKGKISDLAEGEISKLVNFAKSQLKENKQSRAEAAPGGLLDRREDEFCDSKPCEDHDDCKFFGCDHCVFLLGPIGFCAEE